MLFYSGISMSIPSQRKIDYEREKRWSCEVYCATNGIAQSVAQTLLPALDLVLSMVSQSPRQMQSQTHSRGSMGFRERDAWSRDYHEIGLLGKSPTV
jgi:precorrin isomerase